MNPLKRHYRHPSRRVTLEPPPDITKHPKLTPGSTSTSSCSTNDIDIHAPMLSPQPLIVAETPLLGQGYQNSVPHANAPTPALVSTPCPPIKFPAVGDGAAPTKWTGLKRFTGVLGPSTKAFDFGPLRSAIDGIAKCIEVHEAAAEAREEYKSLRNQIDWLFHDLADRFGETTPPVMRPSIMNLARGIEQELLFLRKKEQRSAPNRYVEALNDTDQVLGCYRRIHALLERLALNANVNIWMMVDDQATSQRLDRLSPSHAAWYNSAESEEIFRDECTPDTRLEVLERFRVWQDDSKSEKVYWLNGMAGTGKTTLAYTLCKQLEGDHRLAGNFFCTRQLPSCREAKLILPTIAYQLANFSYPFRYALSQILDQNRDVHTRRISEQFEKLLYQPLHEIQCSLPHGLTVVIDGLDECANDRGVGEILDALFNRVSDMPIKFFLTSRPEPAIRGRMLRRKGDRDRFELHLHELDKGVVREDIKRYLQAGLKHSDLTLSHETLELLTKHSGVLFIYAATVVRYISAYDFLRSDDRLKDVLEAITKSNDSDQDISSLYNMILKRAFGDPRLIARERDEIRHVLETVICAQEPLTLRVMAGIVGLKGERLVEAALGSLRSVLNVQQDGTITTLHKSFPDYMLDPTRSLHFCCDPNMRHGWLTRRCFDLISIPYSPFKICVSDISRVRDDVLSLDQQIKQLAPEALSYAHRYWGVHLRLTGQCNDILDGLGRFLLVRLLLSMEVVNLTMVNPPGIKAQSQASIPELGKRTGWDLVTRAVAVAISLQRYDLALEWFEQGHSTLWGQALQLHTPYDDHYTGNLEMAKQLQQILYRPECLTTLERVGWPSAHNGGNLHENAWRHRLAERRKELLDFARLLPQLEGSLYPPNASKLVSLVEDGPAVIMNLDRDHCDALVIRAATQEITHLPLTRYSVQQAKNALAILASSRHKGGFIHTPVEKYDRNDRKALAELWYSVAHPVLDHLGLMRLGQTLPRAGELPQITWCITGAFSSLPLHAAGDYGLPIAALSERVISSYTPTISSLGHERASSPSAFLRL